MNQTRRRGIAFKHSGSSILFLFLVGFLAACATAPAPVSAPTAPTVVAPATTNPPAATALPAEPTTAPTVAKPTSAPTSAATSAATVSPTLASTAEASAGAPTATLAKQVKGGFVSSFGWAENGQTLTTLVEKAAIQYSIPDLEATNTISTNFASPVFALSPDGTQFVGLTPDGTVQVWDTTKGAPVATMSNPSAPIGATYTPDGAMVATYSADEIEIQLWDANTGALAKTLKGFQTAAPVYSAVFAPDDKTMAWVSRGTVQFMDMDTGKLGTRLEFEDFVGAAQFTPDSQSLVTLSAGTDANPSAGVIQVWSAADGKLEQELTNANYFNGMSVSPVGTALAAGVGDTLVTWDWKNGGDAKSAAAPGQIALVDFSSDGKMLATGDQDGNVVVWTLQ